MQLLVQHAQAMSEPPSAWTELPIGCPVSSTLPVAVRERLFRLLSRTTSKTHGKVVGFTLRSPFTRYYANLMRSCPLMRIAGGQFGPVQVEQNRVQQIIAFPRGFAPVHIAG